MAAEGERHEANRVAMQPLRRALYDFEPAGVQAALSSTFHSDALVRLAFPFEDLDGATGLFGEALSPLHRAIPDLERRDLIVMAGPDDHGNDWVGCCGHYTGTFMGDFLGIPPTGHQVAMRYHEFFRLVDGRVAEMQALWDIPEVMMQAGVWPMGPSLGREWLVPGPADQDGIVAGGRDAKRSEASKAHVLGMLGDMGKHPTEPVEAMRLDQWWHPRFSWYGPAGIGTARGITGFRHWHQIPFLRGMPDRRGGGYDGSPSHFFADGAFVGVTAWPGMAMTVSGDGWLGIAPSGTSITMRSLDFWRVERRRNSAGEDELRIRENWVLVDLLHAWDQLGVSVLDRMRELCKPRQLVARGHLD